MPEPDDPKEPDEPELDVAADARARIITPRTLRYALRRSSVAAISGGGGPRSTAAAAAGAGAEVVLVTAGAVPFGSGVSLIVIDV
jgi:hypothetical protein